MGLEFFDENSITLFAKDKLEKLKNKGLETTALDICILSEEKYFVQLAAVDQLSALEDKAERYKKAYESLCVYYKQVVTANEKLGELLEAVEHQMQRTICTACGNPLVDGLCANQSCAKFVPLI